MMRFATLVFLWSGILACGPPLRVSTLSDRIVIHVESLGEYPTSIRKIQVAGEEGVVWEIEASGEVPKIHTLTLWPGANAVLPGLPVAYRVNVPRGDGIFLLEPAAAYRVTIWGAGHSASIRSFVVPSKADSKGGCAFRSIVIARIGAS